MSLISTFPASGNGLSLTVLPLKTCWPSRLSSSDDMRFALVRIADAVEKLVFGLQAWTRNVVLRQDLPAVRVIHLVKSEGFHSMVLNKSFK